MFQCIIQQRNGWIHAPNPEMRDVFPGNFFGFDRIWPLDTIQERMKIAKSRTSDAQVKWLACAHHATFALTRFSFFFPRILFYNFIFMPKCKRNAPIIFCYCTRLPQFFIYVRIFFFVCCFRELFAIAQTATATVPVIHITWNLFQWSTDWMKRKRNKIVPRTRGSVHESTITVGQLASVARRNCCVKYSTYIPLIASNQRTFRNAPFVEFIT